MIFDDAFNATIEGRAYPVSRTIPVINPATEAEIAQAPNCGVDELAAAVNAARKAFLTWRTTPIGERQQMLRTLSEKLIEHRGELARLLTIEQGKPLPDAAGEITGAAHWCATFAAMDIPVECTEDSDQRRVEVRRTPLGVVAALTPWNFPVILAALKLAPALVAGNTVILKPSPFTPLTTLKIGEIARGIFPPGVLNVLSGDDALGPLIAEHPQIHKISFTGSTATGKRVMASAAGTLKRITLELGGNDAAIVMPDVDVEMVAKQIFTSAFTNSGQVCAAAKRIYVHAEIYEIFSTVMVKLALDARLGDGLVEGTRFGPLQNKQQYTRICGLIEESHAEGHSFLVGGELWAGEGYFVPFAVVDNPPDHSRIVREEQFGPIVPLLKFTEVDEVIKRANDSLYGLGSQVWSGDIEQAEAIANRIEAGNVWINQIQAMYGHSPFGGHKASGIGVESSLEGLLAYTNAQTFVLRKRSVAAVIGPDNGL